MFSSSTLTDRPTEPLGIDIGLSTDYLEDHWGDDEAKCEALHKYADNGDPMPVTCTVRVTHRHSSCAVQDGMNVCEAYAVATLSQMKPGYFCGSCGRPSIKCLSVIPV